MLYLPAIPAKITRGAQLTLFTLVTLSLGMGCRKKESAAPKKAPPLAVRVMKTRKGPLRETISYIGTLGSRREAKILARLAGSLTVLPAAEGAKVKEGQIVARLATP
ncbi:MAG: efflux RND transporter periplasmic adaptor subunit, partial [Deltaproteobacteria bacterium]|nr:efflux RND transporter periplasmic adaptor subunit [Deltaproteobacteria bacterium]